MTIREILTPPAPALREPAEKVRAFTSELRALIEDMVETMREAEGVGLAAPQIGVGQRVIVVEYQEGLEDPEATPGEPELYKLVNPEIVRRSNETVMGNEGCLSLPGYFGEVERARSITLRALTPAGELAQIEAEGWLARIFQHEVDHLDGVLFVDRATQVWEVEEEEQAEASPSGRRV